MNCLLACVGSTDSVFCLLLLLLRWFVSFLTESRSEAADGFVNPLVEGREPRVHARQVGAAAADAETHDAHLEPLAVFLADQRTAAVTLFTEKLRRK